MVISFKACVFLQQLVKHMLTFESKSKKPLDECTILSKQFSPVNLKTPTENIILEIGNPVLHSTETPRFQ
jgi:hypothetical protein